MPKKRKVLLVEPEFPIPPKSKNHSNFLPIGLLKLASYYRQKGHKIKLNRGNHPAGFYPNNILVTSLFTYWSEYVKNTVQYYKKLYPKARIGVGGVYATLMPEHCKKYTGCNYVFMAQHKEADKCKPAYDLVNVDYQIIHGMRGCINQCPFCGIWRIEKLSFKNEKQIEKEICTNHLIFYDNNLLVNPYTKKILKMLANKTYNGRVVKSECQSGFDGRILIKKPYLAKLLKEARFENIRVAWDFPYERHQEVEKWIELLEDAGFNRKEIFVFMIYNWDYKFEELENKRKQCYEWGVQIADCRFRPLTQTFDRYNSRLKEQTSDDYYISPFWTDKQVRTFRRRVRMQNICIRYNIPMSRYKQELERLNSRKMIIEI